MTNVNFCHVIKYSLYLWFCTHYIYAKISSFMPVSSITIVWYSFYLLVSCFEKSQLESHVCRFRERDSTSL